MNLVDLIKQQFAGGTADRVSETLGESPQNVTSALSAAIPTVLAALTQAATRPGGARTLMEAVRDSEDKVAGPPEDLFRGKQASSLTETGSRMLSSLFGGGIGEGIVQVISRFSGLNLGSAKNLIGMILPFIMGNVGKYARSAGISDPSGLTNFLSSQASNITSAMPAGLKEQLNAVPGLSSVMNSVRGLSSTGASAARATEAAGQRAMAGATRGARSPESWLIPAALALAIVAGLGYWLWPRLKGHETARSTTPAVRPTETPSEESSRGTEGPARITGSVIGDTGAVGAKWLGDVNTLGNPQLGQQLTTSFNDLANSLAGVHDPETAQTAETKLRSVAERIDGWQTTVSGLPEQTQERFRAMIRRAIPFVESATTTALAVPGAQEHLRPLTDQILQRLHDLAQETSPTGTRPSGT